VQLVANTLTFLGYDPTGHSHLADAGGIRSGVCRFKQSHRRETVRFDRWRLFGLSRRGDVAFPKVTARREENMAVAVENRADERSHAPQHERSRLTFQLAQIIGRPIPKVLCATQQENSMLGAIAGYVFEVRSSRRIADFAHLAIGQWEGTEDFYVS
jgi:hypothetical protein